jgi:hypothetical protein
LNFQTFFHAISQDRGTLLMLSVAIYRHWRYEREKRTAIGGKPHLETGLLVSSNCYMA